ncbi:hypothetical protein [Methylobacterium radiodurans]|uniref:Uncharacterized protein n=1 Tax=Methylobacterium radiodurans TaxID=2202828 RepID=A0A2U8VNB5_9HYPH|nr:hypothetical protein [Methylobacterium radiodurans]AWN35113.1 hypothetical protein DK427_04605 [Methylobacterium radiodurans]
MIAISERWLEVTPSDFLRKTVARTSLVQKELICGRNAHLFLLRVVLRERFDLKSGGGGERDPLFVHDYRFGHSRILCEADEVVIERADGVRYLVDRAKSPWTALTM